MIDPVTAIVGAVMLGAGFVIGVNWRASARWQRRRRQSALALPDPRRAVGGRR